MRRFVTVVLCQLLVLLPASGQQAGVQGGLRIVIVEGAGAKNVVQQITPRPLIVRVEDATGHPVAGASVLFTAPEPGPSGEFSNDFTSLRVTTGEDGMAITGIFHPNAITGPYQIKVRADFQGQIASAVVPQVNISAAKSRKKLIAILGISAAAIAAVIASRAKTSSASTTPTITLGGTAVGAPAP